MCNFYIKNYISAAFDFKKYYDININKKIIKVESGLYNYIYCLYLSSLDYNLNPENIYNTIYGIKEFIKQYSNSYKLLYLKLILDKLLKKIEKKEFEIAKINYKLGNYNSAFLMFKNFITEYPNSILIEKAFYYAINAKINFIINNNNIKIKKKNLQKIILFCNKIKKKYPIYLYNLEKIIYNINIIMKNTL